MASLLVRLFTWLGGSLVGAFTGWRLLFLVTFLSYLGITLYNFLCDWFEEVMGWLMTAVTGVAGSVTTPSGLMQNFTGVVGYFLIHLRVLECVSFIVTIVITKWTIKMLAGIVPGVKWG